MFGSSMGKRKYIPTKGEIHVQVNDIQLEANTYTCETEAISTPGNRHCFRSVLQLINHVAFPEDDGK